MNTTLTSYITEGVMGGGGGQRRGSSEKLTAALINPFQAKAAAELRACTKANEMNPKPIANIKGAKCFQLHFKTLVTCGALPSPVS